MRWDFGSSGGTTMEFALAASSVRSRAYHFATQLPATRENESVPVSTAPLSAGAFIDMHDLAQVLAHVHDAEMEIGEGP
jgi:hypothetical protein